jgi:hypothetical protein
MYKKYHLTGEGANKTNMRHKNGDIKTLLQRREKRKNISFIIIMRSN